MGKWIRRIVMILLLGVFVGSLIAVLTIQNRYRVSAKFYEQTVKQYVLAESDPDGEPDKTPAADTGERAGGSDSVQAPKEDAAHPLELAPFAVDFSALKSVGPDVIGWIYCEGTNINYPVVQGPDDDYYLHKSYDGSYNFPGSIFMESENSPDLTDIQTIIYGHNMRDNSMFAFLDSWSDQSFYDSHRVIWLLTPERDYKIELFAGYTTSAYSDTYVLFSARGEELDAYLQSAREQSDFQTDLQLPENGNYVLLSTCAYVFDNARYVLHGFLTPVDSAGGIPLPQS